MEQVTKEQMDAVLNQWMGIKRVYWTLVDDSSPYFNVWHADCGYNQCFWKGENPNLILPYGQHGVKRTAKHKEDDDDDALD